MKIVWCKTQFTERKLETGELVPIYLNCASCKIKTSGVHMSENGTPVLF